MVDNPNKRVVLELFHHTRRLLEIQKRLSAKLKEINEDVSDSCKIICLYAPLKVGDFVVVPHYDVSKMLQIIDVALVKPEEDLIRPRFRWTAQVIRGIKPDGNYVLADALYVYSNQPDSYRIPNSLELAELIARLPALTNTGRIKKTGGSNAK